MSNLLDTLPRKWKIGSYTFRVEIVPSTDPRLENNDGLTVFPHQCVYLDQDMMLTRAAVVVLHEAIHVINWVFGVDDESTEETVTSQVSTGLMAFWRDNPKVMTWLNKARKIDG